MHQRMRRLRMHPSLRESLATPLSPRNLIAPLFIIPGKNLKIPIKSMPGIHQLSSASALPDIRSDHQLHLGGYLLFGVTDPAKKDPTGSHAHNPDNEVCRTLRAAKEAGITLPAITDLCYCEYTSHGHC